MLVYLDTTTKAVEKFEILTNGNSSIPTGTIQDGVRWIQKKGKIQKILCIFGVVKSTGNFVFNVQYQTFTSTSGTLSWSTLYSSNISISLVGTTTQQYSIVTPSEFPVIEENSIITLDIISNGASIRRYLNVSLFLEEEL